MCLVALQLGKTWTQLLVSDVRQLVAQYVDLSFPPFRRLEVGQEIVGLHSSRLYNILVPIHIFWIWNPAPFTSLRCTSFLNWKGRCDAPLSELLIKYCSVSQSLMPKWVSVILNGHQFLFSNNLFFTCANMCWSFFFFNFKLSSFEAPKVIEKLIVCPFFTVLFIQQVFCQSCSDIEANLN